MSPRRVKVTGDLYRGSVPGGAIYVGRAAPGLPASPYANPFTLKAHGPAALAMFGHYLRTHLSPPRRLDPARLSYLLEDARRDLAGRDLACWCRPDAPCHADILLRAVNDLGWPEVQRRPLSGVVGRHWPEGTIRFQLPDLAMRICDALAATRTVHLPWREDFRGQGIIAVLILPTGDVVEVTRDYGRADAGRAVLEGASGVAAT